MSEAEAFDLFRLVTGWYYKRKCGSLWEDQLHDGFIEFLKVLRSDKLMIESHEAIAMHVAKWNVLHFYRELKQFREAQQPFLVRPEPEDIQTPNLTAAEIERWLPMVLASLKSPLYVELIQRFYFDEQPPEQIQAEMGLSYQQFREAKGRAMVAFGKRGRSMLHVPAPPAGSYGRISKELRKLWKRSP